ncbi:MAG: Inositol 2-dehydrogenase/D-chiro-inositol 3-dehydrogenase [bacterium]|nr:Inositol 2-dehydrogenase/D-chiro-inositol 3-dehydrogenase [bacterium]
MRRRDFLRQGAVGLSLTVAPLIIPRRVLAGPEGPGANDRIHIGLIGPGGRAHSLLDESPKDVRLVALADCDLRQCRKYNKWVAEKRPDLATEKLPHYQDYRAMFEKEKLDAAIVATTTHARALICIHSMQAGLDVYSEKPLTLTIEEGRYLVRAEQRYQRILQVGTQQRSVPIDNFGSDLVKNGALGKVHTVLCPNFIGPEEWSPGEAEMVPEELNWDMWCHQTELVPYTKNLHPGLDKWGKWRAYDGGGLSFGVTGWGTHAFDQVQRALGTDDTTPTEVRFLEDPGPNAKVSLHYASGVVVKCEYGLEEGPGLGGIFIGEKGRLEINRNKLVSDPPELINGAPEPDDKAIYASVAGPHLQNWVDCMRTRQKPNASAEVGHNSSVICHLINIARELGRPLKWDPAAESFVGDEEANALRSRPRRKGYELPVIS